MKVIAPPSFADAEAIANTGAASSLVIVPVAVLAVERTAPVGLLNVTLKVSFASKMESPLTLTVIVFVVSPARKLTLPVGKVPPKSAALAGLTPLPITAKLALLAMDVSPERVTVNVNGVVPLFPSFWVTKVGAIARVGATNRVNGREVDSPVYPVAGVDTVTLRLEALVAAKALKVNVPKVKGKV